MSALAERWSEALPAPLDSDQGPEWLRQLRRNAAASFRESGLPQRRDEAWKYTPLRSLEALAPDIAPGQEIPEAVNVPKAIVDQPGIHLVVADGKLAPELPETPPGVSVLPLMKGMAQYENRLRNRFESLDIAGSGRGFEALNTALLGEGLLIHVDRGVNAGCALLQWVNSAAGPARLSSFRLVVLLEPGARLRLVEQYQGESGNDSGLNIIMQVDLGTGADLVHVRLQYDSDASTLITSSGIELEADSSYDYAGFDLGGALVRHELKASMNGAGARARFSGAFVADGLSTVDNHICVDHAAPGCSSEQFFRGVLGGRSRGVFNGKAVIQPGADGSSVRQSNANLLLSPQAEMDTKPELEIYADEVEASHGATVGQLDETAVFYMRTRGLSDAEARLMLTGAFCQVATARLADAGLEECISAMLDEAMPAMTLE